MRRFLAIGGLVVLLAACGSSGGSTSGAGSSSTTSTTGPADPSVAADRRIAAVAVVRPTDLPGWTVAARPPSKGSEIKDAARSIPACATFVAGLHDGRVAARSKKLTKDGTTVTGDADVYATAADLQAQLDLYRDPTIVDCLQQLFTKALQSTAPAGATVESVSVSPIAVEDVGDGSYGFRMTAAVTRDGAPQTILRDIVGVTFGRVGVSLTVTSSDAANLAEVETTVLPILAQRVHDAQG